MMEKLLRSEAFLEVFFKEGSKRPLGLKLFDWSANANIVSLMNDWKAWKFDQETNGNVCQTFIITEKKEAICKHSLQTSLTSTYSKLRQWPY
jgi:hypothetical protein